jgi:hypothetical protein
MSIVQPSSFTVSKVSVGQLKVLDSGGKMAYVNYGDSRNLVMQTPSLPSPFGLNVFDKAGPPKFSFDLALRGYQENPKVRAFYEALVGLDEYMIELGVKNSKLWFKSDMKREVIEAFYSPIVKFGRDKEGNRTPYPPNVKLQLKKNRDGNFETEFYDENAKTNPNAKALVLDDENPIESFLVKKVEVTALMQCTGVWFAGGKFGLSWKAVQVRLDSVPAGLRGYGFVNDDAVEEKPSSQLSKATGLLEEETPEQPTGAQEDEEEDEEVAAVPVPKKGQKVMTIKKALSGGMKAK